MRSKLTREGDHVRLQTPDCSRTFTLEQFAKHARDPDFCADLAAERDALVAEAERQEELARAAAAALEQERAK